MKVSLTEYRSHTRSHAHMFRLFTHTHLSTPPPTSPRSLAGLFASGLRDFLSNFRWMISPQQRSFLSFFSFSLSLSLFFFVRILLLPFWRGSELRPARCLRSLAAAAAARSGEASKEGFFPGWSPRHLGFSRFRSDRTVFTESRDRCGWNKEEGEKNTHQRSWSRFVSTSFVRLRQKWIVFPELETEIDIW